MSMLVLEIIELLEKRLFVTCRSLLKKDPNCLRTLFTDGNGNDEQSSQSLLYPETSFEVRIMSTSFEYGVRQLR